MGMYLEHFALNETPFAITPDPRFVFLSERHREALAHLRFGIAQGGSGGFVLLTGDIGTGKTTLCRLLLEQLPPAVQPALLLNPRVTALELLESLCDELGVKVARSDRRSGKALVDALNAHLLAVHARGAQVVAIIDEAQNLSADALEQVRLLTNLETSTAKLMQIVLLGQPELRTVLAREDLAQLAQRITARYHLSPLGPDDTGAYLRHRLAVAGSRRFPFTRSAVRALYDRSGGVPRRLNIVADRALTGAFAEERHEIDARLVHRAADETLGEMDTHRSPWTALVIGALALLAIAVLAVTVVPRTPVSATPPVTSARSAAPGPSALAESRARRSAQSPQAPSGLAAGSGALEDDDAVTRLLALWQLPPELSGRTCDADLAPGVHCLRGVGSLERVKRFGAPVLVEIERDGTPVTRLLLDIEPERVRLAGAKGDLLLGRAAFEQHWLGGFRAIWRAPAVLPESIARGSGGAPVMWLEQALAAAGVSMDGSHRAGRFDAGLEAGVRALQRQHGLREDGIVGRETQWLLASRAQFAASRPDASEPNAALQVPLR